MKGSNWTKTTNYTYIVVRNRLTHRDRWWTFKKKPKGSERLVFNSEIIDGRISEILPNSYASGGFHRTRS